MPSLSQRFPAVPLLLLLFAWVVPCTQAAGLRYPVEPSRVASALAAAGVAEAAANITLPTGLTATEQSPDLVIGTAQSMGPRQLRVRLSCRSAGVCLPFFAELTLGDSSQATADLQRMQANLPPDRRRMTSSAVAVRAGQRTVLFLEDRFMRITMPVISIDTGAPGSDVRVATLDRKQSFHGTVSDDGSVRSVLP